MTAVAHWDEIEPRRRERGHMAGSWRDLGAAAASVQVGVQRIEVDPVRWSTPLHLEGGEEEIFFVLGGSGVSVHWDGETTTAHEVRAGDCIVYLALEVGHTLHAGPEGLDVLAFGMRTYAGSTTLLPRAGVSWLGASWVESGGEENHPWAREAAAGEPEAVEARERPASIVGLDSVAASDFHGETVGRVVRDLGTAAGSLRTGLRHFVVEPGMLVNPPHCHSAEEELFVVLDGEGVLVLGDEEHPVRAGSVVARPPGTRVPHTFRAAESGPLTLLAFGTRRPEDVCYYPRSGKIALRGVGVVGRIEPVDYWEGER